MSEPQRGEVWLVELRIVPERIPCSDGNKNSKIKRATCPLNFSPIDYTFDSVNVHAHKRRKAGRGYRRNVSTCIKCEYALRDSYYTINVG